jgi:hypothetical protein
MEVPQVFAGSDSGTGTFKGFGGVGDSGGVQFFGLVFDAGGIVGVDLGQGVTVLFTAPMVPRVPTDAPYHDK